VAEEAKAQQVQRSTSNEGVHAEAIVVHRKRMATSAAVRRPQ
jgi:hypothetical protein